MKTDEMALLVGTGCYSVNVAPTSRRRLRAVAGHVVVSASDVALEVTGTEGVLSASELAEFEETGVLVLRGCLSPTELASLAGPQRAAFANLEYDGRDQLASKDLVYPAPGVYSMGPKILESAPETGAVSCGHPKIVAAVEALFGEPAVLAQYWSIMRPPGAGVPNNSEWVPGRSAHVSSANFCDVFIFE
jgi:hypothetical protein